MVQAEEKRWEARKRDQKKQKRALCGCGTGRFISLHFPCLLQCIENRMPGKKKKKRALPKRHTLRAFGPLEF
jgi:hypothetical protein